MSKLQEADIPFLIATGVDLAIMLVNTALRLRFIWWPLRQLGYPLAGYYHFERLWFPYLHRLVDEVDLSSTQWYQGLSPTATLFSWYATRQFTCGSGWEIVGLIAGARTYTFKNW